jgi:pyridinium-3,5-biscarboxylic acid mononucleotide synthase
MNESELKDLLRAVQAGALSIDSAAKKIAEPRFTDLGFARVDHERELRCGFPEVVFCLGKQPEQAAAIAARLVERSGRVLLTRANDSIFAAVKSELPDATWHADAQAITVERGEARPKMGLVAILAAGTSDQRVAAEAKVTAEMFGARVEQRLDVGVAGIHRLFAELEVIRAARVVIVAAGMEGALASVVGGLVRRPVIAVPTSVGYGASFNGLAALLTMLNSCAANVAVVNIDNGFGAGYLAGLINADEPEAAADPPR